MKIIGHRGARGLAPENTLASLRKALEHSVDEVEFDVRVTKDHVPILHHDPDLVDPGGQKYVIKETAFTELVEHKLDLLTLEELLSVVQNKLPVCLEIKPGEAIKPIVKILEAQSSHKNILLASRSQKTLLALHKALPEIEKIVIEPWSGLRAHRRARQIGAKRISMNQLWLWSGFIRAVTRGGHKLTAYTVNNPKKARRWAKHGLDSVVTDYPDRFEK